MGVDWLGAGVRRSLRVCVCVCVVARGVSSVHGVCGARCRDKLPPYSAVTSLASAAHEYPGRDILLAMYHVPQVGGGGGSQACGMLADF